MTPGIAFQPGAEQADQQQAQGRSASPSNNVQEAIKVLSLRLPKVVGARSVAPSPLLSSQGSNGNSRVDSVVNSVMSRMFPTQGGPAAPSPMLPSANPMQPAQSQPAQPDFLQSLGRTPRVVIESPFGHGDSMFGPDGRPSPSPNGLPGVDGGSGFQPATIAEPPPDDVWKRIQQVFQQQMFQPPASAPTEPQKPYDEI